MNAPQSMKTITIPIALAFGLLCLTLTPIARGAFTLNKAVYDEGEAITASFTDSPGDATDWVGIYSNPGNGPVDGTFVGGSTIWLYTNGTQSAAGGITDGAVTFANPGLAPGNYIAFFLASDGYASIEEPVPFSVQVAGAAAGPEFLVDPVELVRAETGQEYGGRLGAYATGNALIFSKVSGPEWLSVEENGDLSGTPAEEDLGLNAFRIQISDAGGLTAQADVNLTVTPPGGAPVEDLSVMTYNLWVGGTPAKNLAAIIKSGVDIIGLQETTGERATQHAEALGWHAVQSGGSVAVLSKYPIVEQFSASAGVGARIRISTQPFQEVILWSCHLTAFPYGPYDGCFDSASEATILANETTSGRLPQVQAILTAMQDQIAESERTPVFLVGDFNTPSHLDWTAATASSHCDYTIDWPVTKAVEAAGLTDTYRAAHPDPAADPGNTWSPIIALRDNAGPDPEPQDRIDMIHFKGEGVTVQSSEVYLLPGTLENIPNHGANAWASDHASVVSVMQMPTPDPDALSSLINPTPQNDANEVSNTDLALSWSGGDGADSFQIYLGENPELGIDDLVAAQAARTYSPELLDPGVRYYWRVDSVKNGQTLEGAVWNFTTDSGVTQIGLWEFDEGSGEQVAEASGNGITGTLIDVDADAWTDTDVLDKGIELSFDNGWISFGDDPRLRPESALTVAAWIKPATYEEWGGVAGFVHDTGSIESGYSMHTRSNGRFGWGVASSDTGVIQYLTSPGGHPEDAWYHVVGTYDGSEIALFVNGQEASRAAHTGPIDWDPLPEQGFIVGSYLDDNDDLRYNGEITQLAVWRKALSPVEIQDLFVGTGSAICPSGLSCETNSEAGTVTLTWVPGRNLSGDSLEILRNGTVVAEVGLDADSYTDTPPNAQDPGKVEITYTLRVKDGDPDACPGTACGATFFNGEITDDLVLYLRLDGDFLDRSPNPLTTTVSGTPLPAAGRIGQAYQFTDTADPRQFLSLEDADALRFGEDIDFSISLWVQSTSAFTDNRENGGTNYDPAIISNKDWNSGGNPGWVIAANSSNQGGGIGNLEWNIGDGGSRADFDQTNVQINDGEWHHILVSHDRDGDAVFYLDGIQVGTVNIAGIGDIDSDLPTNIGTDGTEGTGWENWFPGSLDDVAIWRRVVTPAEVSIIHANGLQGIGLPSENDTDGDGLPDDWEIESFGDIDQYGGIDDPDEDQLSNLGEWRQMTDPNESDTDGDGAVDGREVAFGTDALDGESLPPADGVVLTQSNRPDQSWADGTVWSDGQPPALTRAYFVNGNAPTLRTPLAADPVFAGGSLTLLDKSQLRLQHSGSAGLANLMLKGGQLFYNGISGGNVGLGAEGNLLHLESDSTIGFSTAGTMTLHSRLTGTAALTITGDNESNTVILANPSNAFTGELRVQSGRLSATHPAALEDIDITLQGGIFDPGGDLNSPNATLLLASAESTVLFRHQMAFQSVKIAPADGNEIALEEGEYDSDDLNELGLGVIFGEGGGRLIIGGSLTEPEPSPLRIVTIEDLKNGRIAIVWTSAPGTEYGIQSSETLASWQEIDSLPGGAGPTTRFELERTKRGEFLRIVAKAEN